MSHRPGFHGHYWTLLPWAAGSVRNLVPRREEAFRAPLQDERIGALVLTGYATHLPDAQRCAVIVHGLGGSARSPYLWRARRAALERGTSVVALNLRGADRSGDDLYHAGLSADLHAAFASDALARYRELVVVGYSLGGHVALRVACEAGDPRLRAVAALCAPLDLSAARTRFDRDAALPYRRNVLRGMRAIAFAADARRSLGFDRAAIARARTLAEIDALTVVPRFAFRDLADYDARASVAPLLGSLRVPALYVGTTRDPMVARAAVEPYAQASGLEVRWTHGGHVGFPGGAAVEREVFTWFDGAIASG